MDRAKNVTAAAARKRRRLPSQLIPQLPPPRLLAVAISFAFALLFLILVLLSTSPPSPPQSSHSHHSAAVARSSSSSSTPPPPPPRCSSLGELGNAMVSMLPSDLPFTVFVPSSAAFARVLGLQDSSNGTATAARDPESNTYAVLSRVLGFSAVPRRLLAADVPPLGAGAARLLLDSVSGLGLYAYSYRDDDARGRGAIVVNGVRSECVDVVRGETVVHVVAGVLMDAEFERSFSAEIDG